VFYSTWLYYKALKTTTSQENFRGSAAQPESLSEKSTAINCSGYAYILSLMFPNFSPTWGKVKLKIK